MELTLSYKSSWQLRVGSCSLPLPAARLGFPFHTESACDTMEPSPGQLSCYLLSMETSQVLGAVLAAFREQETEVQQKLMSEAKVCCK